MDFIITIIFELASVFLLWRILAELRVISSDTKKRDELGKSLDALGDLIATRAGKKKDA